MLRRSASTDWALGVQGAEGGQKLLATGARNVATLDREVRNAPRDGPQVDDPRVLELRHVDSAASHGKLRGARGLVVLDHRGHLGVRARNHVCRDELADTLRG